MSLSDDLTNPESDIVRQALTRRCKLCHQPAGIRCTSPINGKPLTDRIVHHVRTAP